jgi:mono/diheme cytochrome c family protein
MIRVASWSLLSIAAAGCGLFMLPPVPAGDKKGPDKAALDRTREQVKMLDTLYKTAVVSITNSYVEGQSSVPAAMVAKDVFAAMHKAGYHNARLIDATGKPKNKKNIASTDFEKKAVAEMKSGKTYYEEVAEVDGKHVFRAATIVPVVLQQCATCHGKKEGTLLGAIVYELPVK